MDREYQGFIFTKHALQRLDDRSITQEMVVQALQHPDKTFSTDKRDTTKFIRTIHDRKLHVVATYLQAKKQWLVVSVWVRGEEDQQPFMWQLLTLPFKLLYWLLRWASRKFFGLHI